MPVDTPAAVDVTDARKEFGAKVALDGVDLAVPAGAFCVLLGPSGSGKTTLLRCTAGIERLSSGRIAVGGRLVGDGATHLPPEKRNLSMVFQDYALWPHLTAARNVGFALGRAGLGRRDAAVRARSMLERVGLGHLAERYPNELSGGEQQRVALARALVAGTGLLLFDEPLSNLDADLRERMRIEIGTLARESGATSIYITHDQAEAFALADMIGVLEQGRLVQVGAPEDVYHHPADPFVARFTGLAGELPVVVSDAGWVDEGGGHLVAVRPELPGHAGTRDITARLQAGPPPGVQATLFVRPAGVQLLPAGHPDRHLDAVVLDSAYRGRGYDHALDVGAGRQLVGVHDERRWGRGGAVAVRLAPAACLLFPGTAGDTAPSPTGDGPPDHPAPPVPAGTGFKNR
jgi:ABC-type Fe3+/spermidine/putrescine transport system ATPase subunit